MLLYDGGSSGKESAASARDAGDVGSILGWGRSPGGGNGNPLQYSCLENPTDRGAWWALVHRGHQELDMTEQVTHFISAIITLAPPQIFRHSILEVGKPLL